MARLFPTKTMALLLGIGLLDLVSTALLYHYGMIVELNPLMRPLLRHSEWTFVLVKGLTLVLAWAAMRWYATQNLAFVRTACLGGCVAYVTLWTCWMLIGRS